MIVVILFKKLRRDLRHYNSIPTDEEKVDDMEEYGWKLVHADVIRPPLFLPWNWKSVVDQEYSLSVCLL